MKKQILFVDDEQHILEGLNRLLRVFRREWDLYFALSAAKALELLSWKPMDVIVTDMHMPGKNGAELLAEVMKRYPRTIRIILSGRSDPELSLKSVSVAHQCLSKPCEAEILKATIIRTTKLRTFLQDGELKQLVSQIGGVPSIPSLYFELSKELASPEASIQRIGQIISRDPGMTAKILQLASSAFFGRGRQVTHPTEAVSYLGLDRIQHLFLAAHVFSQFEVSNGGSFSIDRLWKHSTATAILAKRIAEEEGADKRIAEQAFTAGMMHDVGQLMLAARLPARYEHTLTWSKRNNVPFPDAERKSMGASHAEVGAYLLGLWGLPDPMVEAVAFHHNPSALPKGSFCPLTALHIADALEYDGKTDCTGAPSSPLDMQYLAGLGLNGRIGIWQKYALDIGERYAG
jgi:HD-like signal output (HDOD) protein/CheY-like chemotaxis protein